MVAEKLNEEFTRMRIEVAALWPQFTHPQVVHVCNLISNRLRYSGCGIYAVWISAHPIKADDCCHSYYSHITYNGIKIYIKASIS